MAKILSGGREQNWAQEKRGIMFSIYKRPFASPNAVIYSYELSKLFLDDGAASILEVGCGIGIFSFRYASVHTNVFLLGVDHSERTIEFLTLNYGKYYENLQLRVCDFCEEGLCLGRVFDVVYSSDVLEHVANTRSFADNVFRHLRAGGKAVINFPNQTTHGINHFREVDDVRKLFGAFSDVRVFVVNISHPVDKLWFAARSLYEGLFSPSSKEAREHLYSGRDEQGIDCFEDSTCFKFINSQRRSLHLMASIFAEVFLLIRPSIKLCQVERGAVLNNPRLVVVATK